MRRSNVLRAVRRAHESRTKTVHAPSMRRLVPVLLLILLWRIPWSITIHPIVYGTSHFIGLRRFRTLLITMATFLAIVTSDVRWPRIHLLLSLLRVSTLLLTLLSAILIPSILEWWPRRA
jgi:hypothetical protein